MLRTLRRRAGVALAAAVFASFVLMDVPFSSDPPFADATVRLGEMRVDREEFRRRLAHTTTSSPSARPSRAEMRAVGRRILQDMTDVAALDAVADALGLAVSDDALARAVFDEPAFHGPDGAFDERTFRVVLRREGLSEEAFADHLRRLLRRRQVVDGVMRDVVVPRVLRDRVAARRAERRAAAYVRLMPADAGEIGDPTPEDLQEVHARFDFLFAQPERRAGRVMILHSSRLVPVPDAADLRRAYDASLAEFQEPERRALDVLIVPDAGDGDRIREILGGGGSLDDAAVAVGVSPIDLGVVEKGEMISPQMATIAFSLDAGDTSGLVRLPYGYGVVRVREVRRARVRSFEEVRGSLLRRSVRQRSREAAAGVVAEVEDALAVGRSLADVAEAYGLEVVDIPPVDRSGRPRDGRPPDVFVTFRNLAEHLFSGSGVGMAIENADGDVAWIAPGERRPAHVPALTEIGAAVADVWRARRRHERLNVLAERLVGVGRRAGLDAVAETLGREPRTSALMTRDAFDRDVFSRTAAEALFALGEGEVVLAPDAAGDGLLLMTLKTVEEGGDGGSEYARRRAAEEASLRADLLFALMRDIRRRYVADPDVRDVEAALDLLIR